jgi:hypothetical protein
LLEIWYKELNIRLEDYRKEALKKGLLVTPYLQWQADLGVNDYWSEISILFIPHFQMYQPGKILSEELYRT